MDRYIIVFLVASTISLLVYSWIALANWRLSNRAVRFNGDSVVVLRLLAVLCTIISLNDLFWIAFIVSPFVFDQHVGTHVYNIMFVLTNIFVRAVPAIILFYLWRYLIRGDN